MPAHRTLAEQLASETVAFAGITVACYLALRASVWWLSSLLGKTRTTKWGAYETVAVQAGAAAALAHGTVAYLDRVHGVHVLDWVN